MKDNHAVDLILDKITVTCASIDSILELRLFGSQQKKKSKKSDIDVLIISENHESDHIILKELAKLTHDSKMLIHPILYDIYEYEEKKGIELFNEKLFTRSSVLYKRL